MADEADVEHRLGREGLDTARALLAQPGFGAVVEMLLAGVMHHVHEEEREVLPSLKREMSTADRRALGDRIAEAKQEAGEGEIEPRRNG